MYPVVAMLSVRNKMLIARMANRALRPLRRIAGLGMRARCKRSGIEWDLDLDEGIDLSIFLLGAYEPATHRAYASLIRPGDIVWDIGANIGAHTLHFANLVGRSGRVFAFEPTDYAVARLRENLALNLGLLPRVSVQQRFLVAEGGDPMPTGAFSRWPVGPSSHDVDAGHLGKREAIAGAQAVSADDFFEAEGLGRLDFVKIDVDGCEAVVMRGFRRSLARFRPRILVELAPYVYQREGAPEFDGLVSLIGELGYRITIARTGRAIPCDPSALRRIISPGSSMNCLLHPR